MQPFFLFCVIKKNERDAYSGLLCFRLFFFIEYREQEKTILFHNRALDVFANNPVLHNYIVSISDQL